MEACYATFDHLLCALRRHPCSGTSIGGADRTEGRSSLPCSRRKPRRGWRVALLDTWVTVAGLSKDFPDVACDAVGLCVMTTSMGYANAATSVSAVIFSGAFDLTRTYFLVAGIAGVDPSDGTLGSALWARYVIDGGLRHEIDPRQVPSGWPNGMLGLGAEAPGQKPTWGAGTEVYHLSDQLVDRALALTSDVELADSPEAEPIVQPTRRRQPERRRSSASATRLPWTPTGTAR